MHQFGPSPILWVEFDYRAPMDKATSSLFGSLLHPYWRESEAQLTEKQAVLLMHDIYVVPTGMEEAPKVALDIHCLWQGGAVALTSTIN